MDPNLPAQNNPTPAVNKKVIIAAAGIFFILLVVVVIVLFSKPAAQKETQKSVPPTLQGNLPSLNTSPKTPDTSSDKVLFSEKNFPFAEQIFPEGPLASSTSTVYQGYTLIKTPDPSGGTRVKFVPSVQGYQPFEVLVKPGYRLYFSVESPSDPQEPAEKIDLGENFAITVDPEGFVSE